ncbi:MAG: hypothetical protein IJR42_07975 [Paludibacteraceae bacterium]|nr:hypothetical protein [Paludibacteraceae bacterium]
MKKILLIAVLAVASLAAYAQPRAIGANLGSGLGFSYQHGFGETNMLDVAVSVPVLGGWGIGGKVTYDWIDPFGATVPWNEKGEWHWYMGVGGSGGIYGFNAPNWYVGAAGHFGIEYDFWFPLQLSLDWRPTIGVVGNHADNGGGIGFNLLGLYDGITLGVRYKF